MSDVTVPTRTPAPQTPVLSVRDLRVTFTTPGVSDPCGVVTYATPTGSDNCAIQSVVCAPASGACFPVGMTTVTCTATDTSNNTAQCTFKITVSNPCTITCPANITKNNDPNQCGAVVTFAQAYEADGRALGITGFVFPAETPGFRVGAEAMTMGLRGIFQGAIHFDHLRVEDSALLGNPGEGLAQANKILMGGRLGCVAFSSGAMHRCVQIAGRYIAARKIATGLMIENGAVSDAFAQMLAKTVAIDLLFDWLCAEADEPAPLPDEIYCAAKIIAPEWAFQVADGCMQLMGGRGYEENNVVARVFRDIRVIRIFEGPTETIRYHLGGLVARAGGAMQKILSERLGAADIFQILSGELTRARAHEHWPSRSDQQRLLSWLGEMAAHGLLWAVVRQAGAEPLAARIAEAHFRRAVETPPPGRAWANAEEVERLRAACESRTGDVEPHQPGENWTPGF